MITQKVNKNRTFFSVRIRFSRQISKEMKTRKRNKRTKKKWPAEVEQETSGFRMSQCVLRYIHMI